MPDHMPVPRELRYHLLNKYILLFSISGHSLFIPFFFLLNRDIPFYNNIICVFMDAFLIYLNSRYRTKTVYVLYIIEISLHTFFCNVIFGWSTGFMYYYFTLTFYIFLFRKYGMLRLVMFAYTVILFITQYVYLSTYSPPYPSTLIPVWIIYFSNAAANFTAIGFLAAQFSLFADKVEEKILLAKEKAEEGERAKSVFLANMSHEIRSPLNSIIGMINLSLLSGDNKNENEYLNIAKSSADHLLTVINDVLDYSRIEVKRMTLARETFNIHHLIRDTMLAMDSSIYNRHLKMMYEIDNNVPELVEGDPSRLRQVLINLISNAVKFTEKGEIELRCSVISDSDETSTLEFSVSDTGIGIPEDRIGSIFDRFTQIEGKVTGRYAGTGLGLAISRELIELMGGKISVESTPGKGSVFSFQVPFMKTRKNAGSGGETGIAYRQNSKRSLNILIAEDIYTNWLLYEKYMNILGHRFKIVENGKCVLDELEKNDYDMVLMDIEMPEMSGEETLRLIRSGVRGKNSSIPVIAVTGYSESDINREECRFTGFLVKPVEIEDLERIINEALCAAE